jgi:DNA-directed RNA polymerase specialized sigma24 family protein
MQAMAQRTSLTRSLSAYVASSSRTLAGQRAVARWHASSPELVRCRSLQEAVVAARGSALVLAALVRLAGDDQLAQLAVLAALSPKLAAVVGRWRRAGATGADLDALEADLVSACWEAVVSEAEPPTPREPGRLSEELVARAWERARTPRRRELRHAARCDVLEVADDLAAPAGSVVADELSAEIAAAVRAGRISARAAAPVFLTRVAGFSTAEAARRLGTSAPSLRVARSRAERALVA